MVAGTCISGIPKWLEGKNSPAKQETWVQSLGQEDPMEMRQLPTPVLFPGKFHGQRSLVGHSPGVAESDMTEVTEHAHAS